MAKDLKAVLDRRIQETEQRLARLRAMREAAEDQSLIAELADLLAPRRGSARKAAATEPNSENAAKIRAYFEACGNEWRTIKDIVDGARVSLATTKQILYQTQAGMFQREGRHGGGRASAFRLITPNGA